MRTKKMSRSIHSVLPLLIVFSLLLIPAGTLVAQEGVLPAGDTATDSGSAANADLPYYPYVYMADLARLVYERDTPMEPAVAAQTTLVASGMATGIEPDAGSWTPWVIASVDDLLPARPPTVAATRAEIETLKEMAAGRDEADLAQIAYWNAGPPSYRWNQIAMDAILKRALVGAPALRVLTNMHAGIYDATIAAWNAKYAYNRPRPSNFDPSLESAIPNPESPAYPSEYAAAGAAAAGILSAIFPEDAALFTELAAASADSRLLAGVDYPSDVEAGRLLGEAVAEQVVVRLAADGSDAPFAATIPTEEGRWTGANPVTPTFGMWATWVLDSPDQFRPEPPPAWDSELMATEMQELRDFERTPVTNSIAQFWEYAAGGRRNHWYWNSILDRLVLESGLANNPPRAARAYVLPNVATYDAGIACWDAKFEYWGIRPFQLDPEFATLFPTPNHPAYPSAHSCFSVSFADVLGYLFPTAAAEVNALANEAAESRIWAGIHFRADVTSGIQLGHDVAAAVLAHAAADGSQ